jgi:hypothetical protein
LAVDAVGGGDRRELAQLCAGAGCGLERLVLELGLATGPVDLVDVIHAQHTAAGQEQFEHLHERLELRRGDQVPGVGD